MTRTRYPVLLPLLLGALAPAAALAQAPTPSPAEVPPENEEADSFEGVRPTPFKLDLFWISRNPMADNC